MGFSVKQQSTREWDKREGNEMRAVFIPPKYMNLPGHVLSKRFGAGNVEGRREGRKERRKEGRRENRIMIS